MKVRTCLIVVVIIVLATYGATKSSVSVTDECRYPNPSQPANSLHEYNNLTIGTFNVYWLFDGVKDNTNVIPWSNAQMAQQHVKDVARQIYVIKPDVLNLVEVENCVLVNQLIQEYEVIRESFEDEHDDEEEKHDDDDEHYAAYLVKGTDSGTRQNVAMLSRLRTWDQGLVYNFSRASYPIAGSQCGYNGASTTGVSKHYITWIDVPLPDSSQSIPLLVVGLHLKAIPTQPSSCAQREGQATVIRNVIRSALSEARIAPKDAYIIVMGDLNDYDSEYPDVSNNVPTSKSLAILKDREYLDLMNVLELVAEGKRYTHWWDKNDNLRIDDTELSTLDHILVSKKLSTFLSEVKIHNDLYPAGNLNVSDHWPITVKIDLVRLSHSLQTDPIPRHRTIQFYIFFGFIGFIVFSLVLGLGVYAYKRYIDRRELKDQSQHTRMDDEIEEVEMIDSDEELEKASPTDHKN